MNYEGIVIGLLSSIVSSFIFAGLLFSMRPRLVISSLIARTMHDGRKAFVVKIIYGLAKRHKCRIRHFVCVFERPGCTMDK